MARLATPLAAGIDYFSRELRQYHKDTRAEVSRLERLLPAVTTPSGPDRLLAQIRDLKSTLPEEVR
jgi:hypothetical protein